MSSESLRTHCQILWLLALLLGVESLLCHFLVHRAMLRDVAWPRMGCFAKGYGMKSFGHEAIDAAAKRKAAVCSPTLWRRGLPGIRLVQ